MVFQAFYSFLVSCIFYRAFIINALEISNPASSSAPRIFLTSMDDVKEAHKVTTENLAVFIETKDVPCEDYNEWIRLVVNESIELCHEDDENCEGRVFSGVVEGMRAAISLRNGENIMELLKKYIPDDFSHKSLNLLHNVMEILENIDQIYESEEEQYKKIVTLRDNFDSNFDSIMLKLVDLGLAGAKQWVEVFKNKSHVLNNVSTSQCKEKRHIRMEGPDTVLDQNFFSELIILNFLGATYAVFDASNDNVDTNDPLYNNEVAAMISLVSASLPIIITEVE